MTVLKISETQQQDTAATDSTLATARRVLEQEAKAILEMSQGINKSFHDAVEMILAAEGRVIVTGMGKSGHVGKKIAATLSSTGTPSFFVHPAETSHGDMGMIVRGDIVLALSNSGETKELKDLIEYTRRFAIPLISITSNPASALGSRSDIVLLLPRFPEACPNGQAPTTSTTLTMAMGDALAVTLLERKGFSASDFHIFHPGGKLGQQMMRVSEIMHDGHSLPVAQETTPVSDVVGIIAEKGLGCAVITDASGKVSGIVTDGDIRRNLADGLSARPAKEIMTAKPRCVAEKTLVAEAMAIMNDMKNEFRKITSLIVIDEAGKPVGVLHIHDCLRAGFA